MLLALAVFQPVLSLALHLCGFRRTHAWVLRSSQHTDPRSATSAEVEDGRKLAALAEIAGRRGPFKATCLRQSLAVLWLLRRRGLQPELRLGVDRVGPEPDMHAWVELDGIPLASAPPRHSAFSPRPTARVARPGSNLIADMAGYRDIESRTSKMTSNQTEITLAHEAHRSDDVLHQNMGGDSVLLDLGSEHYFGLNAVGTAVWEWLSEDSRLSAIHSRLCEKYPVEPTVLEQDLVDLMVALRQAGLVTIS